MTYSQAAQHNAKFGVDPLFKDPMMPHGGKDYKWYQDPSGMIGFIAYKRLDAFLVHYPIKVLQKNYRLTVKSWPNEAIKQFKEVN